MGVCCVLNKPTDSVIARLKDGALSGLTHVYKPTDLEGRPSLWPDGITDGTAIGWFEAPDFLHFWGGQRAEPMLQRLRECGVRVIETF